VGIVAESRKGGGLGVDVNINFGASEGLLNHLKYVCKY
jgi:hypothetical protein